MVGLLLTDETLSNVWRDRGWTKAKLPCVMWCRVVVPQHSTFYAAVLIFCSDAQRQN